MTGIRHPQRAQRAARVRRFVHAGKQTAAALQKRKKRLCRVKKSEKTTEPEHDEGSVFCVRDEVYKQGKNDNNTFEVKCIMFRDTRKKVLRNRIIYCAIGILIMAFGVWLNYQSDSSDSADEAAVKTAEIKKADESGSDKKDSASKQQTGTKEEPKTYLIKEVDGVVKVFVCDEDGRKELYLITSIPFDLLSESDQQLFVDGVTMETEEDLGEFLQNFDS